MFLRISARRWFNCSLRQNKQTTEDGAIRHGAVSLEIERVYRFIESSPQSCYPSVEIVTEHRKLGFSRERVKPSRRYSQITRSEGFWRFCKHPANRSLIPLRGLAFLSNLPFQRLPSLPSWIFALQILCSITFSTSNISSRYSNFDCVKSLSPPPLFFLKRKARRKDFR